MSKIKRIISMMLTITMLMSLLLVTPVSAIEANSKTYTYEYYTIEYTVKSKWENSQSIGIKITNTGTDPILNWL